MGKKGKDFSIDLKEVKVAADLQFYTVHKNCMLFLCLVLTLGAPS